jgi:lipoprotein signal peptidase
VRQQRVARERHLATLATVALLVVLADLATKWLAVAWLADGEASLGPLGERVRLVLVANARGAFSLGLGPHTHGINVALTSLAILLAGRVCRELARIDSLAPRALGLIAGAAAGNLVSLLTSPGGVPDFLAIDHGGGHELVLNLADVAAYAGLALLVRATVLLVRRIRRLDATA